MSEEEKKLRINELEQLERIGKQFLSHWHDMYELHKSRIDLVNGVVLGLIFGVFGNLAVQYSVPILEWVSLGKSDILFPSVIVLAVSAFVVAFALITFRKQQKKEKAELSEAFNKKLDTKSLLDEIEKQLEALKQN
jgi:type VI protein secretion system component VasK